MAMTGHPFPYDIENLLGGAVRILRGTIPTAGVPDTLDDVFAPVFPYASAAGWEDVGATNDAFSYSRGFDTEGWEIQQTPGNVIEEITDLSRSITVPFAEFNPDLFELMENAPPAVTVAAAAGRSAERRIRFGSFESLTRYRWAFVSRRSTASGVVTEPGGRTRGRFVMGVLYTAQIAADEVEMEQAKGSLTGVGVTFTGFPESGQPRGEEWGGWHLEDAGTIA